MRKFLTVILLLSSPLLHAQQFTHTDIEVPVEDKTTKGVLTVPAGEGPFPALVILAGSGPTDFDGNSAAMPGKNNSLKMLAEKLAEQGYASIRYNKRIFAGFSEQTLLFDHFVADAVTAYGILKEDSRFSRIGLAGHSQGSLVGMMAAKEVNADFFISIAGPGKDFATIISDQLHANPSNPKQLIEKAEQIMDTLKMGKKATDVPAVLAPLFRPTVQAFIGSWMKYSPTKEIAKLSMPVLIINGTTDLQVSVENSEMLLNAAKSKKEHLVIDGMNHVLKTASQDRAGNFATYANPDLPLSDGFIDGIVAFLKTIKKK